MEIIFALIVVALVGSYAAKELDSTPAIEKRQEAPPVARTEIAKLEEEKKTAEVTKKAEPKQEVVQATGSEPVSKKHKKLEVNTEKKATTENSDSKNDTPKQKPASESGKAWGTSKELSTEKWK